MVGAEELRWTEMLRDRSRVVIRPICLDDVAHVAALVGRLSPQSRHLLFLAGIAELDEKELWRLCDPDCRHDVAFVAEDATGQDAGIIGFGRYVHDAAVGSAELSVAVADAWQHRGLGTLLLRHLIETAREHGVARLYSIESATNYHMRRLARHLGFRASADPADPRQVTFSLELKRPSA